MAAAAGKPKPPAKEEIEKWTSSMTATLKSDRGRSEFRRFLSSLEKKEGENTKYLDFYEDVEAYKRDSMDRAEQIRRDYLTIGEDKHVSIGNESKELLKKWDEALLNDTKLFDQVQKKSIQHLDDNYFANFRKRLEDQYL